MTTAEIADVNVYVIRRPLSDGSNVFDVALGDMKFACISEDDAVEIAQPRPSKATSTIRSPSTCR